MYRTYKSRSLGRNRRRCSLSDLDSLSIAELRRHLADVVNEVAYNGIRIVLTRHGRRIAALVPVSGLARLLQLDEAQWMEQVGGTNVSAAEAVVRSVERELALLDP